MTTLPKKYAKILGFPVLRNSSAKIDEEMSYMVVPLAIVGIEI
jgi:hypothetical protein